MAKISQYPDGGAILPTDQLVVARAGQNKSILGSAIGSGGGWTEVVDTWTYASANTITVPMDATTTYKKGIGIRWKQGGGYKYAYVTIVAATLLTITGGTDYTVANSAITDVAYTLSPQTALGFPVTFTCAAPTWDTATIDNGTGGQQPTAGSSYFRIDGDRVKFHVFFGASGAVKNGAGLGITILAIPATLPAIVAPSVASLLGMGIFATITTGIGLVYWVSGSVIVVENNVSIADNASIAYTNFWVEYKY